MSTILRIHYLSDLHLEFVHPRNIHKFIRRIPTPSGGDEICVLAGDIGHPYSSNYDTFMNFINKSFKKTFVISGNHEYYHKEKPMEETNAFLKTYFETSPYKNISFLNDSKEVYHNITFIGTTLWSKITEPQYEINDVYKIPHFDYIKYNRLNRMSIDFLEDTVQTMETKNCVIITHHVPSYSLIDPKYKIQRTRPYNQWFYSDMDAFIETHNQKIASWIYGHTHTPNSTTIHGVPMLCNPIGYPNENPWRENIVHFMDIIVADPGNM
jgi:predicted MPP superfamily phosphohydrolase